MLATYRPLLLLTCALLGCTPDAPPTTPATIPHEAPPTPPPSPAASYDAHGTLLGPDGAPMRQAEVQIGDRAVPVDATGAYRITAPGPGFYKIRFSGVSYMAH